jgi:hypothetical protein
MVFNDKALLCDLRDVNLGFGETSLVDGMLPGIDQDLLITRTSQSKDGATSACAGQFGTLYAVFSGYLD